MEKTPSGNIILSVGFPRSGKPVFCEQTILRKLTVSKPILYVDTKYGSFKVEKALKERGLSEVESSLLNSVDTYNKTWVSQSQTDRILFIQNAIVSPAYRYKRV